MINLLIHQSVLIKYSREKDLCLVLNKCNKLSLPKQTKSLVELSFILVLMSSLFPVLLSVTVILSVVSATLWVVMYEFLGVATISVLLSGLLAGYLFSSIVFYTPFGKLECTIFKAHVQSTKTLFTSFDQFYIYY